MNVRVELMETDGEYIGIVYSRGFDQNTTYGCDFLVGGRIYDGKISLVRKQVMRLVLLFDIYLDVQLFLRNRLTDDDNIV